VDVVSEVQVATRTIIGYSDVKVGGWSCRRRSVSVDHLRRRSTSVESRLWPVVYVIQTWSAASQTWAVETVSDLQDAEGV